MPSARPRSTLPLVFVPWLTYVALTVVAPALNGATAAEAYADHAVITLGVSGAILMLWLGASPVRPGHGRRRSPSGKVAAGTTNRRVDPGRTTGTRSPCA